PDAIWNVRKRSLGAAVRRQTKKSPVPTWKRKSATTSGCRTSLRYTWRNTFITASYIPSPAGNIKWLAMWSVRKIMTRASADTPWATGSGAGMGRGATTAGTPAPILTRLHHATVTALALPEVHDRLREQGAEVVGGSAPELAAYIAAEIPKWAALARQAGVKPE